MKLNHVAPACCGRLSIRARPQLQLCPRLIMASAKAQQRLVQTIKAITLRPGIAQAQQAMQPSIAVPATGHDLHQEVAYACHAPFFLLPVPRSEQQAARPSPLEQAAQAAWETHRRAVLVGEAGVDGEAVVLHPPGSIAGSHRLPRSPERGLQLRGVVAKGFAGQAAGLPSCAAQHIWTTWVAGAG